MSEVEIHPTAIVNPGAELGVGVKIGPYSIIGSNVKIGDESVIGPHAVVEGFTTLGKANQVFQFASVGGRPQDLKYKGEPSTLVLGDRNLIREYVTIHPGTAAGTMTTIIGSANLFMANSHVGHDCRIGDNNVFANSVALAGHVEIHNNVILGGLVGVHQFARIGSYAILSAGSMVGQDIPPFCIGQGDRCFLRGVNVIALERSGKSEEDIAVAKRLYRHFFTTTGRLEQKLEELPSDLAEHSLGKLLTGFFQGSSRGITGPAKE